MDGQRAFLIMKHLRSSFLVIFFRTLRCCLPMMKKPLAASLALVVVLQECTSTNIRQKKKQIIPR
jgi:hypothetical protein